MCTQGYWFPFSLMPPVMNDNTINRLQLVNFSKQHIKDNDQLVHCLSQLKEERETSIVCLVEQLYGRYLLAVQVLFNSRQPH
jgi:hypothetical protein